MSYGDRIDKLLHWVYEGAVILHKCGGEFQVGSRDGSGWWLKRLWNGESERYSRADLLLFFEPRPIPTRFQRVDDQ